MLLHEQRQGDASRVAGYVRQLPRDFCTPLHWSPAQRTALQYPHLQSQVTLLTRASAGCRIHAVQYCLGSFRKAVLLP